MGRRDPGLIAPSRNDSHPGDSDLTHWNPHGRQTVGRRHHRRVVPAEPVRVHQHPPRPTPQRGRDPVPPRPHRDPELARHDLVREPFPEPQHRLLLRGQFPVPAFPVLRPPRVKGSAFSHTRTLARYAGNALPHLPLLASDGVAIQQWHKGAWLHRSQARWCPRCLRSTSSRWLLRWKLPWSFACVDHAVYMVTECQSCWDTVDFRHDAPPPRNCENMTDEGEWTYDLREPCGHSLNMCQPVPVSDTSVLTLQERVNSWLDGTPTAVPTRRTTVPGPRYARAATRSTQAPERVVRGDLDANVLDVRRRRPACPAVRGCPS
ncbi:TniQ family protein [Streptomyces canus]|uniref:TniQ family protein n=1 Tax=Streptomyces canus TaxID=58343 RepID=UPI003691DE9F